MEVTAICKVVAIVAEGDSVGFAYGTLPKHPECGEESFVVSMREDDSVVLTVRAVSKPAVWFTKIAGPLGHAVQKRATTNTSRLLSGSRPRPPLRMPSPSRTTRVHRTAADHHR